MLLALYLAQAQDPGTGGVLDFLSYGVLGLVVVALITGLLDLGRTTKRETERADRVEEKLAKIQDHMTETVVPLLTRAIDALERLEERRSA